MAVYVQRELLVEPATVVTTAAGLRAAVASGDPHIEIQQHLDLRDGAPGYPTPDAPTSPGHTLPGRRLQDVVTKPPVLGTVADSLRAIRVSTLTLVPMHVLLLCKGSYHVRGPLLCTADACIWMH